MKYVTAVLLALLLVSPAQSLTAAGGAVTIQAQVTRTDEHDGRIVTTKQLKDRKSKTIGWGNTVCWELGNGSAQCVGTFVLPRGKINVAGTRHNQNYFVLSIVGGTGLYVAAGGTLIANTFALHPRRERLVFLLR